MRKAVVSCFFSSEQNLFPYCPCLNTAVLLFLIFMLHLSSSLYVLFFFFFVFHFVFTLLSLRFTTEWLKQPFVAFSISFSSLSLWCHFPQNCITSMCAMKWNDHGGVCWFPPSLYLNSHFLCSSPLLLSPSCFTPIGTYMQSLNSYFSLHPSSLRPNSLLLSSELVFCSSICKCAISLFRLYTYTLCFC